MPKEKGDRRSLRTRRLLGDALVALLAEKRYDAITVRDIIDRANVGRTTYYAHYRDKEDLLLSEIERVVHLLGHEALETGTGAQPLLPSLALFRHVQSFRPVYQALMWGRGGEQILQKVQVQLTASLEPRLAALARSDQTPTVALPVLAQFVIGTFLTLLKWWMGGKATFSPEQVDEMFWRLVRPSVEAAIGVTLG